MESVMAHGWDSITAQHPSHEPSCMQAVAQRGLKCVSQVQLLFSLVA